MIKFANKKTRFALSALTLGMASFATQVYANTLSAMTVNQVATNTTQLRLSFDGQPLLPQAYQQDGSNQLVLDFNGAKNALPRENPINTGVVDKVLVLSNGETTRLMVDLQKDASYAYRVEGNELVIEVMGNHMTPAPMPANSRISGVSATTQPSHVVNVAVNPLLVPANAAASKISYDGISAINHTPDGAGGVVTVVLANEAIPLDVQRQGNKIVVRTTGATIPRHLLRRINVGGLVDSIEARNQGNNGILTINMRGDYEYQAYQSGAQLVIGIKPPKMLTEPTLEERVYTGEPLSMEFQDVPVRTVLDVIANFTGQNIVADDSVSGNITLRLINVPWDQALDIILKSRNLDKRVNGNVIWVAPAQALAEQEAAALRAKNEIKELAPLRTEYIRLNYAKAQTVFELFEKARTSTANTGNISGNTPSSNSGLLSPRGSIIVDTRTNTLIVKDTSDNISNIRAMIEKIDVPLSQVMIEARIVTATDSFSKDLGVRWAMRHNQITQDGQTTVRTGAANIGSSIVTEQANLLNVDLGIPSSAGRIAFGLLNISDTMLNLELQAMQAERRGEVVSSPKVLTADKQKARISSGRQIPYLEAAASGAATVSFQEASLSLEVTPNITPDGRISLDLNVTQGADSGERVNGVPIITQDSVQTNVVLEDGQTVVLGGVYRNTVGNGVSKVPFLGDLPYVGRLFKSDTRNNNKEEILIFITPKIVNDSISRIN